MATSKKVHIIKTNYSFNDVWNELSKDKLELLPQNKISFFNLTNIYKDSKRTLQSHADILPYFDKLAHPNGICLSGIWHITEQNPYNGYFKLSSKALIIARASTAMSKTKQGEIRVFGLAGKLFPTTNKNQISKINANFFLIDDLGGSDANYFTQVELTNEPKISITSEILKNLPYSIKITHAFSNADTHPTIRQLYEISYLNEGNQTKIITPKWMKIKASKIEKNNSLDFRDELSLKHNKKLIFYIWVANKKINGKKNWQKIGNITFRKSIISKSCDHKLHFHHPIFRDDLTYE